MKAAVLSNQEAPYSSSKLWLYCLLLSIGSFQYGYAVGIYNPMSKVWMTLFNNQGYSWSVYHQEPHNTLVNTVAYIGAFIGAMTGQFYVVKRRVFGIYAFNLFCIVGSVLCCIVNFVPLYIGRFLLGYGAGAFSYLIPIMLNEVSPPKIRGATSVLFQISVTLGIDVAALIGFGLPHNIQDVSESNFVWRVLVGLPVVVGVLQILAFATCYRFDTPVKYLENGEKGSARRALGLVYDETGVDIRLQQLESSISLDATSAANNSLRANSGCAIAVCLIFSVLQQFTGINAIIFYSAEIFGSSNLEDIYQGIVVAVLVGSVNFVSTLLALGFVEKLGRKIMIVIGFFLMMFFDVLTGVFQYKDMDTAQKVTVLLFVVSFEFSSGPLLWTYLAQVLNPGGVTAGAVVNWLFVIVISLVTPQLAKLGQWMFYIFAIFNLIGGFFSQFAIIESKGRSKAQIQQLYRGGQEAKVAVELSFEAIVTQET